MNKIVGQVKVKKGRNRCARKKKKDAEKFIFNYMIYKRKTL